MSPFEEILEQELDDAVAKRRRVHGRPFERQERDLARDIVGAPRPAPLGLCVFCGTPSPMRSTCEAHRDLEDLDPASCEVVTTATSNGHRPHSLDGKRAAGGQRGTL